MVVMLVQPFVSYAFRNYTFFYKNFFVLPFKKVTGGVLEKLSIVCACSRV